MDSKLKAEIRENVLKRMVSFDIPGTRQSRRMPGMFIADEEVHGFGNLCIYIDLALSESISDLSEILELIDRSIYEKFHYNHTRWIMYFGNNSDKLLASPPSDVHQIIKSASWQERISRYLNGNQDDNNPIISRLHNPGSQRTHSPSKNDLAVFFCKGNIAYTSAALRDRFTLIRKRTLWFFFTDTGKLEFLSNGYVPDISPLN